MAGGFGTADYGIFKVDPQEGGFLSGLTKGMDTYDQYRTMKTRKLAGEEYENEIGRNRQLRTLLTDAYDPAKQLSKREKANMLYSQGYVDQGRALESEAIAEDKAKKADLDAYVKDSKDMLTSGLMPARTTADVDRFFKLHDYDRQTGLVHPETYDALKNYIYGLPEKDRLTAIEQLSTGAIEPQKQFEAKTEREEKMITESGLNTRQQRALENAIELEKLRQEGQQKLEGVKATAPPKMTPTQMDSRLKSNVTLQKIDTAIDLVKKNPDLVGPSYLGGIKGLKEDIFGGKDQEQKDQLNTLVGNISSIIVKDMSGAAVGAHEFDRLKPWLPNRYDRPEKYLLKLDGLKKELEAMQQEYENNGYVTGTHSGTGTYAPPTYGAGSSASSSSAPQTEGLNIKPSGDIEFEGITIKRKK